MTDRPKIEDAPAARTAISLRNRVVVGFAAVAVAFTGLILYSLYLYRQTVADLSLINSTYLPLNLGTSDVRATQLVFNTLMDRLADDPDQSITRDWLDAARRYRPAVLRRLSRVIRHALAKGVSAKDEAFLREMASRLDQVGARYRENESRFVQLYSEMDSGQLEKATQRIEGLKRSERLLDKVLAGVESELNRHVTAVSVEAESDGARALVALAVLTLGALLMGLAIGLSTHRSLAPLKRLEAAVATVALGDLATHIAVDRRDEIGVLADGFNRMTAALAERDKRLIKHERLATAGKMAAQVTHEIRNPLSSLGLNADLLEEELRPGPAGDEARALLHAMRAEIDRLTGITESYLSFARLPAPAPRFADLNELVTAVLEFMRNEIAERGIEARAELDSGLERLLFDPGQIRQAAANLIRNACEAMPDGGALTVSTMRRGDEWVELAVADTGPGIPAEASAQIFESFYTTKTGGTGLGLAMVRQIGSAHGGDVRHEPVEGGGSRFVITLPLPRSRDDARSDDGANDA